MKKVLLLAIFIDAFFISVDAQPTFDPNGLATQIKNAIPTSPNAAALGKFGDIPVGYASGIPAVSIPIYNWKSNRHDIALSISLDYHAGGYKVEEMASNVGLGWALNAGGMISRSVRGLPDDYITYGYLNSDTLPPVSNYDYSGGYLSIPISGPAPESVYEATTLDNNPNYFNEVYSMGQNQLDAQQDLYSYAVNGLNGKFVIDKKGHIQKLDDNRLIITLVTQAYPGLASGYYITGFIITDEQGIKYTFSAGDQLKITTQTAIYDIDNNFSINEPPSTSVQMGTTNWVLTSISSPFDEESISLIYDTITSFTPHLVYENGFSQTSMMCDGLYEYTNTVGNKEVRRITAYTINDIQPRHLKQIRFPDSTIVDLNYNFTRTDLANDNALTSIIIHNGVTTIGDTLTYDYFTAQMGGGFSSASSNDYTKKLKLTSVMEFSGDVKKPPYLITYNSSTIGGVNTPNVDYWGYYTGAARNNSTLIPALASYLVSPGGFDPNLISLLEGGADRSPDKIGAGSGMISRLAYPTGGYTDFTFETNDCTNRFPYYHTYASQNIVKHKTDANIISLNGDTLLNKNRRISTSVTFDITLDQLGEPGEGFGDWDQSCPVSLYLVPDDGSPLITLFSGVYANLESPGSTTKSVPIGPGYQIKLEFDSTGICHSSPDFLINIVCKYEIWQPGQLAGGVRIKTLKDVDPFTGKTVTRQFSYTNPDSTSSGNINTVPNFDYYKTKEYRTYNTCPLLGECAIQLVNKTSNANVLLGTFGAGNVVYTRVTEKRTDATGNTLGSTIYEYTPFSGAGFLSTFPYPPGQLYDWQIGLPVKQSISDSTGVLLKTTENGYQYFTNEVINQDNRSFKVAIASTYVPTSTKDVLIALDVYPYIGRSQKSYTVTREYNGGSVVYDSTSYTYDSSYYVLKSSDHTTSKGIYEKYLNYYPQDYSGNAAFTSLVGKNMINAPTSIEVWETRNGQKKMIQSSVSEYGAFNGAYRLKNYYLLRTTSPVAESNIGDFNSTQLLRSNTLFQKEISINNYDFNGNVTDWIEHDGANQAYIWDYANEKVIAHAVNTGINNISYTSFESDGDGGWTIGSPKRVTGGVTGDSCYDLSNGSLNRTGLNTSSTYILSYWKKDGAPLSITGTIAGYPITGRTVTLNGNNWTYYEYKVSGVTSVTLSGSGLVDELRLYPDGAQMTTYTHHPLIGVTSECSINNRITYYEYDALRRLKVVKDQDGNIIKTIDYHYTGQ